MNGRRPLFVIICFEIIIKLIFLLIFR